MDILHRFKENGYFTAELYHLLAKKKLVELSEEIVPSVYEKEMKMSTSERLQTLNSIDIENIITRGSATPTKPVLAFTPRILVFQNFKPNEKFIAKFSVKNISQAPTFLNMVYKESSYFSIKPCGAQLLSRLAPGISVSFAITFVPIQYEDYIHRVTFYTDVDHYVLPLIAMGPRPIFNFPDEITLPSTPLKIECFYNLTVINVGKVPAGFTLIAKPPFSVNPRSAKLNPDEKIDLKVSFKTMRFGQSAGFMTALLETGEKFVIKLFGSTHTVKIELEKEIVRFPETFNTMVRQQTFKIVNKSDHLLTYMCMKNESVYHDFDDKFKLATIYYDMKESEATKYRKLVEYDVISSEEHERVYTRIFFDELQALVADESLQFQNTHFAVTPIKGQLWPKKTTELTIVFSPKEIGDFNVTVYLDIDGIPDRIVLKIVGSSMPPSINLNLETLDMDRVYISKTYHYEIVAINKGHINGVIMYKDMPSLFGSTISCTPEMHCLRPGEKEIFIVSFCNSNQGPYFEEMNFIIRDTNVILKLYLKGTVIYPSLMFSIPCLDFGIVSLGVPKTLELEVINESVVNVVADVKISSDGPEISSITLNDCAVAENPKLDFPQWPREFHIEPSKLEIGSESRISLKVTLTANLTRANQTSLELELEKSDSPPIILPVIFNAMVPEITPAPDIKLRACFIDFPYHHDVVITSNDIYGYFTLVEEDEESKFKVEVGLKRGLITPNSTVTIPVTISTSELGQFEHVIRIFLFGVTKPIEICRITGCGVRPIVTCTPISLQWGQVKLLTRSHKTLTLCNDSPVRVFFRASLLNRDTKWIISPTEGVIEPEGETELILSLYLVDADSYVNKALIQLERVRDILVPLSATGVGTSIVVGEYRDKIVLGRHFTKIPLNFNIMCENFGTRLHSLDWSEYYKPPKTKFIPQTFFNLEPRSFKIGAGEKIELTITGQSQKVALVKEVWYLIGSVEGVNKKELLLECQVIAEFVDPRIEVSALNLTFQYDYGPYSEYYKLTDILTIKNVSKLPLDIDLNVKSPFAIVQRKGSYKIRSDEENLCCCIWYDERDLNVGGMVSEVGEYQSKIYIDYLTLKPVESLRHGRLKFFQDIHKIKSAFNLTYCIEQRLEDEEVMKIQIVFDTTKHTSQKSRVYTDLMKIKFRGHKNKDAIKLVGKINFPNVLLLTPKLDFHCILNGSIESKSIKLKNIMPLLVCYRLQWRKVHITALPVPILPKIDYKSVHHVSSMKMLPEKTPTVSEVQDIMMITNESPVLSDQNPALEHEQISSRAIIPSFNQLDSPREDTENDFELLKTKILRKITPMIDMEYKPKFGWTSKLLNIVEYNVPNINDILQLVPHRGRLKPNDVQYVHVIFRPKSNMNVRAVLECEVLGGPSEYINVTGQSSDLMYTISTQKINFKIRSFHELASENLIITNVAQLPFQFKTYLNEPKFENELHGTIRELVPSEKVLEHEEEGEMNIIMSTGVVGYFNRSFLLEIGHLPHITIEVFGWGVIPQIYLTLQRPDIAKLNPELGYLAIPTLTLDYLAAVAEIFSKDAPEHLNSPQVDKCFEDPEFQNDWHICSSWDCYPSNMDIELAIERMLVINHIKHKPEILTAYINSQKCGSIPGFITTPYVIDYGVVITGSTVQCIAEVINYGPIPNKLHFAKYSHPPAWLIIKLCGKLNPGESGKLEITFTPTAQDFTQLEQHVEASFNIEAPYGVTIPIQVKALCAVPYLMSNVHIVDLGSVRCGDKIVCSVPLKNVGKPTCIWYVTLRLKAAGPNPITILESSGKYEPGEGGWLNIAFKPIMEMTYEGLLIFRYHMNPHKMTIPIIGHGIMPHVHIIGPNVNFLPTLPWAETTDNYFGFTNPCPFPIELIILHSDIKWKEEEEMFQLLHKYYNKPDEMLVPAIKPGEGMPHEVQNFYKSFKEKVKRELDVETSAAAKTLSARPSINKKAKSPKPTPKTATARDKDAPPPRKFRTEAEIIADEIKCLKDADVDPLKECLASLERPVSDHSTEKHTKGLIIFVHGSPCEEMESQEMAYTLGKRLGIPTVNIDLCLVEALRVCQCTAKNILLNTLNDAYEVTKRFLMKDDVIVDESGEEQVEEDEDEFYVLLKKIEFLSVNKNVGTPRSKTSDKKKKEPQSVASHTGLGSTTMFHMDYVQELLSDFFNQAKFSRGFILDTLNSIVLKNPSVVLTTVLKSKHSIRNINLVLCQGDFVKWAHTFEESQREAEVVEEVAPKVYTEEEIDEIINKFEEMDEEEYENADPELRAVFIAHGLEHRRRMHMQKLGCTSDVYHGKKEKVKDGSKSVLAVIPSDSKKKMKKEDAKGKPNSEYVNMNARYNDYLKNTYENLVNIANNWMLEDGEMGYPLYTLSGQMVGAGQKKTKKKSEIQIQVSDISLSNRGFPLTLITCPCQNYKEALVQMFETTQLVKEALKIEEEVDILKSPVEKKEYTVLLQKTMPFISHEEPLQWFYLDEPPVKKCECNQITDLNLLDDSTQDNVLNILSKWHCSCGKKVTSSQTSTSEIPSVSMEKVPNEEDQYCYPLPLASVDTTTVHCGRVVLQPGDLFRCKYTFSPQNEGNFSVKRFIEVSGWPDSRAEINVNGICDLPRLDNRPKKMFQNFVRRTIEENIYKHTFLDDMKLFEFGPIFIGINRIYEEEYTIDLKNSSLMLADVVIEFLEDTEVFQIDKSFIQLEPGCRGKLTISAAPEEIGVHTAVLLFCVKNNPEIIRVNIACSGVVPNVEILPQTKMIDYGKLLLFRREDDRFIVRNDSILPIMWKIRNPEDFVRDFIISQTSGIIPRHDNQVVPVTYIACNVGVIVYQNLVIDIYDELGRGDPMLVDVLYLSGECYDVTVECAHENPNETYLNYGNVKVNSTVLREMYLLNRGKYNIYYKLKKVKNFPEPSLLKSFEAFAECGIIPPTQKLITIEFECTPTTSMNLVNVPAYMCSLLDGSKDQVIVAKFPVCITIASFYNTFTLFPLGELNFNIIPVGSGVMRDVILNNTSKCPFTYEIELPQKYHADNPQLVPQPGAAATIPLPIASKGKDTKIKTAPMKCGSFLIVNEDNLLAPGASRTIQIQFLAAGPKKYEETIKFIISDTCPSEAQGVPLKLVGTGAIPQLDFWNVENTFREHLIVKRLSEYKARDSSPHCVFSEDNVTLTFFSVNVNTSYMGPLDLYNDGVVPCLLKMKLYYQNNTTVENFSLDKYDTHIEPFQHKRLGIVFTPKAIEEYRAVLDIRLKLLQNQEQSFKLCLIGEGVIPRIRLITPPLRQHKLALLQFPVTCLGSSSKKGIRFKNISTVTTIVTLNILQQTHESRPIFWMSVNRVCENMIMEETSNRLQMALKPNEIAKLQVFFNPMMKGKTSCDIKITITDNPYEYFTVLCEAEAFLEDVILLGLEMLPMDMDVETYKSSASGTVTASASTVDSRKKTKSAPVEKKKPKPEKKKKISQASMPTNANIDSSTIKYILDFGGCELCAMQKRTVIMVNNSEKVYKFNWMEAENIVLKPSVGFISPGEEKDIEIIYFSAQPAVVKKELLNCSLIAVSDDYLTTDKGATWDNRQILTMFEHNRDLNLQERYETITDEQNNFPSDFLGIINIIILYSVTTEYTKYSSTLDEEIVLKDTFIYQTRSFTFKVENIGNVPLKLAWSFHIDDDYPSRIDKEKKDFLPPPPPLPSAVGATTESMNTTVDVDETIQGESIAPENKEMSKVTLYSESIGRESVDTWFEVDLPFQIEPARECLKPHESRVFKVTFNPLEAFDFKVRLKSSIDNLDPYDVNMCCKIIAKSLIPYCHLDIEENDYLSTRKKTGGIVLSKHTKVLKFDVLGSGCYKKTFNIINPTSDGYEFNFEAILPEPGKPELVPVHCDLLKGFVEGGTSTEVTFTFAPSEPGVYESHWKFIISAYNLAIDLLVVGTVRESDVMFVPTILLIKNCLVGFTTTDVVTLKNNESQSLNFEFKGNSLCNETGKTPVIVDPENGVLKPNSETPIKIIYTPDVDGPLSFKIFCSVMHLAKYLTLCVNSLSHSINPNVTYEIIGNTHVLNSAVITNIYLDQTASTYERTITFRIQNNGSASFLYEWHYTCSSVKKYLNVEVKPKSGHVPPGNSIESVLHFTLKDVPVKAFPLSLTISDGPEYQICLFAEIAKPLYHFSCRDIDFGKCIIKAPDTTYKKMLAFKNDDKTPIVLDLKFTNNPEIFVDFQYETTIEPKERIKIAIFFRPRHVMEYDIELPFTVNSLCAESVRITGEGVPLLVDLYEGCQKSYNLGPAKVGQKCIRQIDVLNHSKVAIDGEFIFENVLDLDTVCEDNVSEGTTICLNPNSNTVPHEPGPSRVKFVKEYKDEKVKLQIEKDMQCALASLKVVPQKCSMKPHEKVPLKIHFKPIGLISSLNVQLNMKILNQVRPLVRLSGSATGMSLSLSQNSIQFGRVRKRGCRILKVMLQNTGDFGTRFCWQPMKSEEFTITPMKGMIAARTNVTFSIAFRPLNENPFVKIWASCNIENYMPLELAMYATCTDTGVLQNQTMFMECPVREIKTDYVVVTNPSDESWFIQSEMSGGPFETLRELVVDPNSSFDIPIHFKPKSIGSHEGQALFSPLGESALFVTLIGAATHPNANDVLNLTVPAKELLRETLPIYNISEVPESYRVSTELLKVTPDKFDGYYEIKHPDTVKVWGEAKGECRWSFLCFEACEMLVKVMFVNEVTREYQFYNINVLVTPSLIIDYLEFTCRARESKQRHLIVPNPLSHEATFSVSCEKLELPRSIKISKNSETTITLTYSPIVVGEYEDVLLISNELAGTYSYKVSLKCLPAKEKQLEFSAPLGNCIPLRLRVYNRTETKTEFVTTVSGTSIQAEKEYILGPSEKGKFLVWFEPTELGARYCKVSFNSAVAGEYVFNIKGIGTEPTPQGPFEIKAGSFTTIRFKNIFEEQRTFKIFVDREEFYVKTMYESIKPKKEIRVVVNLSEKSARGWPGNELPTGCLSIECYDPPEPKVQWTYYLQGT